MQTIETHKHKRVKKEVLFLQIPAELKHAFKAWCAMRRRSMTNEVVQFMRDRLAS